IMCVLLLRGPQTPGELNQRTARLHQFTGPPAIEETLTRLAERGLAERLARRPGQKEERWTQRLAEGTEGEAPQGAPADTTEGKAAETPSAGGATRPDPAGAVRRPDGTDVSRQDPRQHALADRVERLENEVRELRELVAA